MTDNPDQDPIAACAEIVQKGDPDRFLATMTGAVAERKRLFPLYAFNLEIARAPFMTQEPMVAMIRLQFWRDLIEAAADGQEAPRHEVGQPVSQLVVWGDIRPAPLLRMIEAREGDAHGLSRRSVDDIRGYVRATAGALMLAAGQATGITDFEGDHDTDQALEDVGEASGLANWLMSQQALMAAGRGHVMPDEVVIATLCKAGLNALSRGQAVLDGRDNPALRSAWQAKAILRQAAKQPGLVATGGLGQSEFARRGGLLWRTMMRRW
ncbi:squalene/phytoene synthase family protein [Aliiroseovarius sediminis]|uniref:squalene/phytoene synthase family protein n=1 Tax=Aliiroseovarius sediminis TaxID=2925839 RepID=UPI001F5987E7|nr:squalene/phytoene synthase family protein [Aliiroseovarius sediminis]MCI2393152.1 squalene/phytoene synthase family protein [Aliiroseovarius sediminis]